MSHCKKDVKLTTKICCN